MWEIKELDWEGRLLYGEFMKYCAKTPFGNYSVVELLHNSGWRWYDLDGEKGGEGSSLEDAKERCQKDWRGKIESVLFKKE